MKPELKANILLVDDRPEQLLALRAVLDGLDQNLIEARSGKEALRLVLSQEFALILLDINMPVMDGFETAALIRQRPATEHTPIIFLTAHPFRENHVSRGYSLGAVDYISTPVVPEILRAKVAVFVELYKKTLTIARQAEELLLLEKREHQRRLAEAQERLEIETNRNLFFVHSLDLLAVAAFDGTLKQVNPAWVKSLGLGEADLKGRSFFDFVHHDDQTVSREQWQKLTAGEAVTHFENRLLVHNGDHRWMAWTAAPSPAGGLIYLSARDVTERRQSEEKVRALTEELERRVVELTDINQELESFTYSIAHDLRAPLRAMQGFSKMLLEDYGSHLEGPGEDYARRIVIAAENMDQLIHDLLDYSRLGRAELQAEPVGLEQITADALDHLEAEVQEKQARVQVDKPLPKVLAHRITLLQVVGNLLSNSMKFVAPGVQPEIRVGAESQGDWVRFWVRDNGIGIDPEHHSRIFRVFERLHTKDVYPGTGIGLAVVRRGIERMSGRFGLESSPGNGSRFWIELPAADTASRHRPRAVTAPSVSASP